MGKFDSVTFAHDGNSFTFNSMEFSAWDSGRKAGYYLTLILDGEKQATFEALDDMGQSTYWWNFSTEMSQAKFTIDKGHEVAERLFDIAQRDDIIVTNKRGKEINIQLVKNQRNNVEKF